MLPSAKSLSIFKRSNDEGSENLNKEQHQMNDKSKRLKSTPVFPNVRNQFVIHIDYRFTDNEIIQDISNDYADLYPDKIIIDPDPHVSFLYGHYAVQYHQIEPIMKQLSELIKSFKKFSLCFNHVQILPNSDKTKYFIAICEEVPKIKENGGKETKSCVPELKPTNTQTNRVLIKSIHHILRQYRSEIVSADAEMLDKFIFHTSIAWFLPENNSIASTICDQLNESIFNDQVILVKVNQINIKVGHISRIINLPG